MVNAITLDPSAVSVPTATGNSTNRKARNKMAEWDTFVSSLVPGVIRAVPITKADNAAPDAPGDSLQGLRNSLSRALKRANVDKDSLIIWDGIYAANPDEPDVKSPYLFVKTKADPAQGTLPEGSESTDGGDSGAPGNGESAPATEPPATEPAPATEPPATEPATAPAKRGK